MNTETNIACRKGRALKVGTAAAVGTFVAGVPAVTFATPPPTTPDQAAGEALTDLADRGASWVSTYGIPAAIVAVGAGLVIGLLIRFGKRIGRAVS